MSSKQVRLLKSKYLNILKDDAKSKHFGHFSIDLSYQRLHDLWIYWIRKLFFSVSSNARSLIISFIKFK